MCVSTFAAANPRGASTRPRSSADAEWLRAELLALVNVDTGANAVRGVERAEDHYPRTPDDTLPDLFIEWNNDAPITTVSSPAIGTVRCESSTWRSGDHRPPGLLLATGAHITSATAMAPVRMLDIAPTILVALGVEPDDLDGTPIPWLAPALAAR